MILVRFQMAAVTVLATVGTVHAVITGQWLGAAAYVGVCTLAGYCMGEAVRE